jgi:tryptophan synthase beta chain
LLFTEKVIEGRDYEEGYTLECAKLFAEIEGLILAPETAHAAAIEEAKEAKARNEKRVIAFNYSGHGLLDLEGYQRFLKPG